YFLFATTPAQLASLLFPLGAYPKGDIREFARDLGLPVADKPDSQDICFVPQGHYSGVVERLRPDAAEPGEIVHVDGRALGRHAGIIHYTIGQRRGLGLASPEPLYVVRIDAARRLVVVGPRSCLRTHRLSLRDVNWLGDEPLRADGREVAVRIRSTAPLQPATVHVVAGEVRVELRVGENGAASGQACVFYADTGARARVLGGGWIARAASDYDAAPGCERAGLTAAPHDGRDSRGNDAGPLGAGGYDI
ncbi:MAG TPA: tRNA methyl transferase PRC-barrel domain-containing protein, partial [Hyphomicrobiaceae bacterium]|nr:tRNA methyl transferase PRC-barrel domain-containing protein [Hyphomicrobiaceae bacterium]